MSQENVEIDPDHETVIATEATITCPSCGTHAREAMPTNACFPSKRTSRTRSPAWLLYLVEPLGGRGGGADPPRPS